MIEMLNLGRKWNLWLSILAVGAILMFLAALGVRLASGDSIRLAGSTAAFRYSVVAAMSAGAVLFLSVFVQDCIAGTTRYAAKGDFKYATPTERVHSLDVRTVTWKDSPFGFMAVVSAKLLCGLLMGAIAAAGLIAWPIA